MYLKIAMHKDYLQILEQDTRAPMGKIASNDIKIMIAGCPELRGFEGTLFLRGRDFGEDYALLYHKGVNFTEYLRALEEIVESFVVCLR